MDLNERIASIPPSLTLAVAAKAKAMAAAGEKVCGFGAGEPDFDTPAHIKRAAAEALERGETKYTPSVGLPALRAAIAEKLKKENGLTYAPEQIVVGNGAKHSLFNIFMVLCRPGDEVIVPGPYWLSYPEMVKIAGGKAVIVPTREDQDFKLTPAELEAAITPRSKALVLNSPSNPTGTVYTPAELQALAEIAVRKGLYIVSDEIYEKLVYDDATFVSVGSFSKAIFEKTITVNGFSKAYAMTGWRLGYFAAPKPIVAASSVLQDHSTSGPNTFAQFGAIEALKGPQDCVAKMAAAFSERRAYMYQRLLAIPGVRCAKPRGAFYMLPNISVSGMQSVAFADRLLEAEKVALVPGVAFGADENVRLSYACSMDNIRQGLDRIERFMRRT